MNIFSIVQWEKYYHSVKDEMFIQLCFALLNGTFHLSSNESICTIIALINIICIFNVSAKFKINSLGLLQRL